MEELSGDLFHTESSIAELCREIWKGKGVMTLCRTSGGAADTGDGSACAGLRWESNGIESWIPVMSGSLTAFDQSPTINRELVQAGIAVKELKLCSEKLEKLLLKSDRRWQSCQYH